MSPGRRCWAIYKCRLSIVGFGIGRALFVKLLNVVAGDWWAEIRLSLERERERESIVRG